MVRLGRRDPIPGRSPMCPDNEVFEGGFDVFVVGVVCRRGVGGLVVSLVEGFVATTGESVCRRVSLGLHVFP